MKVDRRRFLETSAAASALAALTDFTRMAEALPAAGVNWVKSVCRYCGTGCGLFFLRNMLFPQ